MMRETPQRRGYGLPRRGDRERYVGSAVSNNGLAAHRWVTPARTLRRFDYRNSEVKANLGSYEGNEIGERGVTMSRSRNGFSLSRVASVNAARANRRLPLLSSLIRGFTVPPTKASSFRL